MSDDSDSGGDDEQIVSLSKKSQLFLQAAISRRFFCEKDAIEIYQRCCHILDEEIGDFADFVEHIAKAIEPYGFNIKKRRSEVDGTLWYAVVNLKSDEATQLATELSANEIKWFRILIERMITAPHMAYCVPRAVPFEISRDLKPAISKTDTQALLAALVLKGWLHRDAERNVFSLSTRSILELESYLVEEFQEELEEAECSVCQDLVFEGLQCPGEDCRARMHVKCRQRALMGNQPKLNCEACETYWPVDGGRPIGIRALDAPADTSGDELDESIPQRRKSQKQVNGKANGRAKGKSRRSARMEVDEDDEEDEQSEEDAFDRAANDLTSQLDRANGSSEA